MDIITNTCSVVSIIIVAPNIKLFSFADCNLGDIRHKVVRNTVWILSHCSALVRSDRIEIAKQADRPFTVGNK